MKRSRFFKITSAVILFSLLLCSLWAVYAKESLSPAIEVLSENTVLTKNGIKNSSVRFSADEFDKALGASRISSITLLSLPDEKDGKLLLGKVPVLTNQIIPRSKLSSLSFVPSSELVESADFVFGCISSGYPRVVSCSVKFSDTLNFPPSVSDISISAYAGVQLCDFLDALDPDCDTMTFTIMSRPQNGSLDLKDSSSGEFVYTADRGAIGEDSFSYFVTDRYGNRSETVTVSVDVKKAPNINYIDISADFEHCALVLSEKNIFTGRTVGKYSYFEPNESLSYDEFIIMAMSASGISLPEDRDGIISVFENISDIEVSAGEVMSVSKALDIASDIHGRSLNLSGLGDGDLTRISAAKIIHEMIK